MSSRVVYGSDNALGIPVLAKQPWEAAPALNSPLVCWGSVARSRSNLGTWHFYTDDRRFQRVWQDTEAVPRTGAMAVVEPNFSATSSTPRAEAIWAIYRKRWLARHWQQQGLHVWVDLYVADAHEDLTLLGVPRGWQRYATSGSDRHVDDLDAELELAVAHSAGEPYTLLVYGGGRQVAAWCETRSNVIHAPHRRANAHRPGEATRRRLSRESET